MRTIGRVIALLTGVASTMALAACAEEAEQQHEKGEQLGYVLSRPIATTNAGTGLGVATDAEKLSARLYPGAFLAGPDAQLLPNPDLVTATPLPQDPTVVNYVINEQASYSDEQPVVCDDFLLTQAAGSRSDLFGSDMPLFNQVAGIDCAPGAKQFTVHFNPGFGQRYRELFTPGTVLPSHTVAQAAEVQDVVGAIDSQDEQALQQLGQAWQDTFNVAITDPSTVPTHGPYRVSARGEKGDLELQANTRYAGSKPQESPIYVWPNDADIKSLVEAKQLRVADLGSTANWETDSLKEPDFRMDKDQSGRVDTFGLDTAGMFSDVEMRRAFNGCVDRQAMVQRVSTELNLETKATGLRMLPATHPLAAQLQETSNAQMTMNMERAGQWLGGQTVRVGYLDAVPRYATMVDELAKSCQKAGVTIDPVPLTVESYGQLGTDYDVILTTRPAFGRNSSTNENGTSSVGEVKKVEAELYQDMTSIPLSTEPRVVAVDQYMANVSDNGGDAGLSWNMDRWVQRSTPVEPSTGSNEDAEAPADAI